MTPLKLLSQRYLRSISSRIILVYSVLSTIWLVISSLVISPSVQDQWMLLLLRILVFATIASIIFILLHRDRQLTQSRIAHQRLLEALLEPVAIHVDGLILEVNEHAVHLFEATGNSELIGMDIRSFVHPDDRAVADERIAQLKRGLSTTPREEKFLTMRGNTRDVEVTGIQISYHGAPASLIILRDVTERKLNEIRIRESESRLRTLINALPDQICFIDHAGRWIEANEAMLRAVELTDRDYQGKTTEELKRLCDPGRRHELWYHEDSGYDVTTPTRFTHERTLQDGTSVTHEVTRVPVKLANGADSGLVHIARDISAERNALKQLLESEKRYRSLFDNDGDMVVYVDADGRIASANPSTHAILGFRPHELLGCDYRDIIAPDYHMEVDARRVRILHGEPQTANIRMLHKNGQHIEVLERKVPTNLDGEANGFFWIIRDITRQRATEQRLIQSERLAAVGQIAAGIAHEIRNPLTAIKGFLRLILTDGSNPFYLNVMQSEMERIESIVNEMLVFAKPADVVLERNDCTLLVQDVVTLMTPLALSMNVDLAHQNPAEALLAPCDKGRFKQVMVNLIKNAIEAIPSGGKVDVVSRRVNDRLISICVRDTGPGMSPEVLARIGDPFYTTKETGTGLGLMVSRRIIESHHGSLRVDSHVGVGTEIEILLPAWEEAEGTA